MNSLATTIADLLKIVPATETDIRIDLQKIADKAIYSAPEAIRERWRDAGGVLQRYMPPVRHLDELKGWKRAAVELYLERKGALIKPSRSEDFVVRPVLHAGEGPVKERSAEEVVGAHTASRALECVFGDEIRSQVGEPTFDDAGSQSLTQHYSVDDFTGGRTFYRVTARLKIVFECEQVPAPAESEADHG